MKTGINEEEEEVIVFLLYPLHCIALRVAAMILSKLLQIVSVANIKIPSDKRFVNEKMDADVTDKVLFVHTAVGCNVCLEQIYRADGIAEMTSKGVFQMTN